LTACPTITTPEEIPGHLTAILRLVLHEVLQNYAKFSHAPSAGLDIESAVDAETLHLRLFAPGPVPAPEALAQIGRPYWQPQARFTGEIPGMGLGLATARLLLRSHGGDLRLATDEARTGVITLITVPVTTSALPDPRETAVA
jgi:K+-sensing histidine kinase KdpD